MNVLHRARPAHTVIETIIEAEDLRCGCGNLLARLHGNELQMKCRRCKRLVVFRVQCGADGVTLRVVNDECHCDSADTHGGCGCEEHLLIASDRLPE